MKKILLTVSTLSAIYAIVKAFQHHQHKSNLNTAVNEILNNQYGKSNQAIFNQLHPVAKPIFAKLINDVSAKGYAVVLTSGFRTTAKQVQLKKENPSNATPGFSMHEYGLALDVNLVKDGKWINKNSPAAEWKKTGIVDLAVKAGLRWGGDNFKGYFDPVHFDLGKKYDINKLYAAAIKQFGSVDKIIGNQLPLVA